jgi:hypothetical protein
VFLAGTIDEGYSANWQDALISELVGLDVIVFNPRRPEWDSSWVQDMSNPQFKKQVEWELAALEAATEVFVYFAPNSRSPISLLELGLYARSGKLTVVCPDGFWKKGNVDIVGAKFNFPVFQDLSTGLAHLKSKLSRAGT